MFLTNFERSLDCISLGNNLDVDVDVVFQNRRVSRLILIYFEDVVAFSTDRRMVRQEAYLSSAGFMRYLPQWPTAFSTFLRKCEPGEYCECGGHQEVPMFVCRNQHLIFDTVVGATQSRTGKILILFGSFLPQCSFVILVSNGQKCPLVVLRIRTNHEMSSFAAWRLCLFKTRTKLIHQSFLVPSQRKNERNKYP